jgi:glycoside/pentoside/hexuronide:cation symporter, GPH family
VTGLSAELTRARLLGYGVGSVGTGIFGAVPGLLLLFFLTDTLGVPAGWAGLVLLVPKAWDVLLNPLVGAWSDRDAGRRGSRTRWILTGAVALPVCFVAMFAVPVDGPLAGGLWVAVAFLLAATAYSPYQVTYVALPAEMTDDKQARTRIVSWRIVALTVGILLAGGLAPALVSAGGDGRAGHALMGAVIGAVLAAALVWAALSTRWVRSRPAEPLGLRASFAVARGNRAFTLLLTTYVLQSLAVSVMLAAAPYLATYRLGDYDWTSLLFVALVAPSIVVVPLWVRAARRYGKAPCLLAATGGYAVVTLSLLLTAHADRAWWVVGQCALLGTGYAAMQLLAFSLLPDTISDDESRTGRRQAGAFTGVWTAGETVGAAAGPALYAAVLAVSSFVSSPADEPVAQPASAITGVLVGATVLPVLLLAVSLPLLARFARATPAAVAVPA